MMKKLWLPVLLMLLLSAVAAAATLEVSPEGLSLTAAVQTAGAGDTIRIAAGTYDAETETFPIAIDKPLTLLAEDGALLDSPRFTTLIEVRSDDVTIRNLAFGVRKWGIVAAQSSRLTLENCSFVLADEACRTSSTAIWMEGMKDCTLTDCRFTGLGVCMAGDPLSESSAGKPVLTGLCEVGQDPAYFTTHTIRGCTVNGKPLYYFVNVQDVVVPADAGGLIAAYCDGLTAEELCIADSSMGLEIVHSKGVVLRNVTAERCGIFGIYVACCEDSLIENVTVRGCNHGIDLRADARPVLRGCRAEDSDQGLFLSLCTDGLLTDCAAVRCGFGFFAAVGQNNRLQACRFADNADGIYLQNEQTTTIAGCTLTGSTVSGVRLLKSGCTMEDSTVTDCWTGALLFGAKDVLIRRCTFDGSRSANLYLADTDGVAIEDCTIRGETKTHLELARSLRDTAIRRCSFTGVPEELLRSSSQDQPELTDNTWAE